MCFVALPRWPVPRSDEHNRWLSAGEALLCQSIPVHCSLTNGVPLCSFARENAQLARQRGGGEDGKVKQVKHVACNSDDEIYSDVSEKRTARIGQAGNAMHAQMVGIGMLFAVLADAGFLGDGKPMGAQPQGQSPQKNMMVVDAAEAPAERSAGLLSSGLLGLARLVQGRAQAARRRLGA